MPAMNYLRFKEWLYMKTEIRTQIQEVPVYIADDGTEFNTEAELSLIHI